MYKSYRPTEYYKDESGEYRSRPGRKITEPEEHILPSWTLVVAWVLIAALIIIRLLGIA